METPIWSQPQLLTAGDGCECPMSNTKVPRVVPAINAKTRQGVPEFPLVATSKLPTATLGRLEPNESGHEKTQQKIAPWFFRIFFNGLV